MFQGFVGVLCGGSSGFRKALEGLCKALQGFRSLRRLGLQPSDLGCSDHEVWV